MNMEHFAYVSVLFVVVLVDDDDEGAVVVGATGVDTEPSSTSIIAPFYNLNWLVRARDRECLPQLPAAERGDDDDDGKKIPRTTRNMKLENPKRLLLVTTCLGSWVLG